jgi:hypothetical protein
LQKIPWYVIIHCKTSHTKKKKLLCFVGSKDTSATATTATTVPTVPCIPERIYGRNSSQITVLWIVNSASGELIPTNDINDTLPDGNYNVQFATQIGDDALAQIVYAAVDRLKSARPLHRD